MDCNSHNDAVKVSVIIPVYNTEKYLEDSLMSIVNQSLKDIEIICIDDGSTDNSLSILKCINDVDSRLIILQQNNKGAGVARNKGIDVARGEYLLFLDSDDIFERNMIENMYLVAKERDADITICNYKMFDKDSNHLSKPRMLSATKYQEYYTFNYQNCMSDIFNSFEIAAWNKLYNHEFINRENLRSQPLKRTNDLFFVATSLIRAKKMVYLDESYVQYKTTLEPVRRKSLTDNPYDCCIALLALFDEISNMDDMMKLLPSYLNLAYGLPKFYLNLVSDTPYFDDFYNYLKTKFYPKINNGFDKRKCAPHVQWFWNNIEKYSSSNYKSKKFLEITNLMENSIVLILIMTKGVYDSLRLNGYGYTIRVISRKIFGEN